MKILLIMIMIEVAVGESLRQCMGNAFNATCKSYLYECLNDQDCSYQLHENTKHIIVREDTTSIPSMYFSNDKALELHSCLHTACSIGQINQAYPSTLPNDYCIMEVWDQCGGDVEKVYHKQATESIMSCYSKLCPHL